MRVDSNWNAESWKKRDEADKAISIPSLPQTVCQTIPYGHRLPLQAALSPVSSKHIYNTAVFQVRSRKALTFSVVGNKRKAALLLLQKMPLKKMQRGKSACEWHAEGLLIVRVPLFFLGTRLTVPEHQPSLLHNPPRLCITAGYCSQETEVLKLENHCQRK